VDPLVFALGIVTLGALALVRRSVTRRRAPRGRPGPYPGDFTGRVDVRYDPHPDGRPDPGEIVWTWVPYEEDHSQGKDRPVLLIGRDGSWLLALMLTSRDHDHDPRARERWLDIGSGSWDRKGRPSEVRLDRIIRVAPSSVRREGAILDRRRFAEVERSLFRVHGW
jgi:hypothetical protein